MRILLIGCGNIGSILVDSWSAVSEIEKIVVVQPSLSKKGDFYSVSKISFISDISEIENIFQPDVVVIAIKPQNVRDTLPKYKHFDKAIFISLCVAISIDTLTDALNQNNNIIRLMPNIAISVGQSTNLVYSRITSLFYKQTVETLFKLTGSIIWLLNEELLDSLSPIFGCAPAYFYLLVEELISNSIEYGLKKDIAIEALNQTFFGAALLLQKNNDPFCLRNSVASKGGITEKSLEILEEYFPRAVKEALNNAQKKLKDLK